MNWPACSRRRRKSACAAHARRRLSSKPDVGVALDVTPTRDMPKAVRHSVVLGEGPDDQRSWTRR